jgi:hypothetical protein
MRLRLLSRTRKEETKANDDRQSNSVGGQSLTLDQPQALVLGHGLRNDRVRPGTAPEATLGIRQKVKPT